MAASYQYSTHPLAEAASYYAEQGMAVFPLSPKSKIPAIKKEDGGNGWKDATTDQAQIHAWWARWPNANIGYAPRGRQLILDIDMRNQGKESWAKLIQKIPMPDTRRVRTSNGYHLYFSLPDGLSFPSKDLPDSTLEIKCETGYLLLPPSIHPDGPTYTWMNPETPLAPLPDELIALLLTQKEARSQEWKQDRPQGSVIDAYNARYSIYELLERYGYVSVGRDRYRRPHGRSGSVVVLDGARSYHHSRSDDLYRQDGKTHDAFSIYCFLEHHEDVKAAVKAAADLLGMDRKPPRPSSKPPTGGQPEEVEILNTDAGNARRLVGLFGQDIRYCPEWKSWLVWNGRFWERDTSDLHLMHLAKRTVQSLYKEAQGWIKKLGEERPVELIGEEAEKYKNFVRKATELLLWARKSEDSTRLHAMIKLARSEPGIPLEAHQLDQDKFLFSVENGTLDLHTGQLRQARREDYITRCAPVTYDPSATCPTWAAFLHRIMDGKAEVLRFLQQSAGYALTGSIQEQVFYLLYGTGANGKSTYLETLQEIMGDYALQTAPETLMIKKNEGIPNDLAQLRGARFVAAIETEDGKRLAEARVKQLTGGDKISARFLFAEWFNFRPEFKLFLATNHKPNVRGTDHAIWRRVRFIPFTVTIPEAEQDKGLPEKLRAERSGILNWMLAGCLDWQQHGHTPPESVQEATKAYQKEQDALQTFLDDECVTDNPRARVAVAQLYKTFKEWAEENHEYVSSQRKVGEALAEKGYTKDREYYAGKTQYVWHGIGLISDIPSPDNQPGRTDVTPDDEKVTSEPFTPDDIWPQQAQQAEGTDVTDVKVGKVKKVNPHVGDFPDFTSVTSETSENQSQSPPSESKEAEISDVTFADETPSAKQRALKKQWLVDPPTVASLYSDAPWYKPDAREPAFLCALRWACDTYVAAIDAWCIPAVMEAFPLNAQVGGLEWEDGRGGRYNQTAKGFIKELRHAYRCLDWATVRRLASALHISPATVLPPWVASS